MLRDQKMGPQGPWESHHHSSIKDLSPRKASVACTHEKQTGEARSPGVRPASQFRLQIWGTMDQFPWQSAGTEKVKQHRSQQKGGNWHFGVKCQC